MVKMMMMEPGGEPEASARGAALLALRAIGALFSRDHAPARPGATVDPDPRRHAIRWAALERRQRLHGRLLAP